MERVKSERSFNYIAYIWYEGLSRTVSNLNLSIQSIKWHCTENEEGWDLKESAGNGKKQDENY